MKFYGLRCRHCHCYCHLSRLTPSYPICPDLQSMVALILGTCTLLCYLTIRKTFLSGPFYFLLPLPVCIYYFWRHTSAQLKMQVTRQHCDNKEDIRTVSTALRGELQLQ